MSIYYSPATKGFYAEAVHGAAIPDDAIKITPAEHARLLAGEAAGKVIGLSDKGRVILVDPPPPSLDEQRARAKTRIMAEAATLAARFTAGHTAEEVAGWGGKAAAARLHLDGQPQTSIIAEAEVTAEDPTELARTILTKADLYQTAVARITGLRRAAFAAIDAADNQRAIGAALNAASASSDALKEQLQPPSEPLGD